MSETATRDWVGAGPLLDADLGAELTAVLEELSNLLPELRFGPPLDYATSVAAAQTAGRELDRVIGALVPGHAHRLLVATRALHRTCQRLSRLQMTRSCVMNQILIRVLARLEEAACSVSELVAVAPELICELGFDRAMISRVEGDVWYPELIYAIGDPGSAEVFNRADAAIPQRLLPGLYETELVLERRPILVTSVRDPAESRWGHPTLVEATGVRSYVAAPILSGGEVVGMLHGDRYGQRKDVDELDRDLLAVFGEAFRLGLSRAALNDRLVLAQEATRRASTSLCNASDAIHRMPPVRVDRRPDEEPEGLLVRTGRRVAETPSLPDSLTSRELDVLKLLAEGRTNAAIARRLSITDHTVKQHVTHVMRKLGVRNRSEAVVRWFLSAEARDHAVVR